MTADPPAADPPTSGPPVGGAPAGGGAVEVPVDDEPAAVGRLGRSRRRGVGGRRREVVAGIVAVVLVVAATAAFIAVANRISDDPPAFDRSDAETTTSRPTSTVPSTSAPPTSPATAPLLAAVCTDAVTVEVGAPLVHPELTEVSGIAVAGGSTWLLNDSGDGPRLYGVGGSGAFRVVDVRGAEAVDWEDLAWAPGPGAGSLWIADTGGNTGPREVVQLYQVPVPGPDQGAVDARRIDVRYSDGPHDVEAVLVDRAGSALLLTKEPGRSRIYRVDLAPTPPTASGDGDPVPAVPVGEFAPTSRATSVVTGAALSADGTTVAIRTYGGVRLAAVPLGAPLAQALVVPPEDRCQGPTVKEVQGEAVAFLPDGSGYVTIGEGTNPVITTVHR